MDLNNNLPCTSSSSSIAAVASKVNPSTSSNDKQQDFTEEQQIQIQLMRSLVTLYQNPETQDFVLELANSNNASDNTKILRRQIREKIHQLILKFREEYGMKKLEFDEVCNKVNKWNLYLQELNLDIEDWGKISKEQKMLDELPLGVQCNEMDILKKQIILNSNLFSMKPKGPIGACISVIGDWSPLIEHILEPFLYTFLVANSADRYLLEEIIDKVYGTVYTDWPVSLSRRPVVWISNFNNSGVKTKEKKKSITDTFTMYDVIHIKHGDNVVRKFLLDRIQLKRIYLFKTQHDAFPVLCDNKLSKECLYGYSQDFFKIYPHPSFRSIKLYPEDDDDGIWSYNLSRSKASSSTHLVQKLSYHQTARAEMQKIFRSMKTIQLDTMKDLEKSRKKFDQLHNDSKIFKTVTWNLIQEAIGHFNERKLPHSKFYSDDLGVDVTKNEFFII